MPWGGGGLRSDSVERHLAERQIHVKDVKSKSWFVYVNKVLEQYGLPSTVDLLDAGYAKAQWKSLYEQAVNGYWSDKILEEAVGKTSMRFMNAQNYPIGLAHLVWRDAGFDIICRFRGLVGSQVNVWYLYATGHTCEV